jgi:uracil-DNA glycosylase
MSDRQGKQRRPDQDSSCKGWATLHASLPFLARETRVGAGRKAVLPLNNHGTIPRQVTAHADAVWRSWTGICTGRTVDESSHDAAELMPTRKVASDSPRARQTRLKAMRRDAEACRRCDLWKRATQVVVGEGPPDAELMLVGEQPGDREDLEGRPFVGPAGRVLEQALADAGLAATPTYVTNAVKHFKWEPRGPRRIHDRPNAGEIAACRMWLEIEIATVKPRAIVALGATAARALLGPNVRVTRDRGKPLESSLAPLVMVTVHPSSILRAPDPETRRRSLAEFVADLKAVTKQLRGKRD